MHKEGKVDDKKIIKNDKPGPSTYALNTNLVFHRSILGKIFKGIQPNFLAQTIKIVKGYPGMQTYKIEPAEKKIYKPLRKYH